jgi:D-alanine-D-alanine ligase
MSEKKRIAVIFGGQSSEHEVSRVSAQAVLENIDHNRYKPVMIGITKDGRWLSYDGPYNRIGSGKWQEIAEKRKNVSLEFSENKVNSLNKFINIDITGTNKQRQDIDVIFPVLHGCNGEDGTIQGMFELAGIPYVGSGVLSSALSMDKGFTKIILEKEGLPQGRYLVFDGNRLESDKQTVISEIRNKLGFPCFIKPCNAGSSIGISKVHDEGELEKALEIAAVHDRRIILEEFIDAREIECAVLGNDKPVVSTVGEVIPCNEFYDYEAKYDDKSTSQVIVPAGLPKETAGKIQEYSERAFKALGCSGLARVDFFVHRKTGDIFINEINTMPGFTKISMYPKLWETTGIPYSQLIDELIELAVDRFKKNRRNSWIKGQ